jgi:hypothetical protein
MAMQHHGVTGEYRRPALALDAACGAGFHLRTRLATSLSPAKTMRCSRRRRIVRLAMESVEAGQSGSHSRPQRGGP